MARSRTSRKAASRVKARRREFPLPLVREPPPRSLVELEGKEKVSLLVNLLLDCFLLLTPPPSQNEAKSVLSLPSVPFPLSPLTAGRQRQGPSGRRWKGDPPRPQEEVNLVDEPFCRISVRLYEL